MIYRDLVFDFYGTLIDIHTEESVSVWEKTALCFGYYGAHYGASELEQEFRAEVATREGKAGQSYECYPDIPFEAVFAELFRKRGVNRDADRLGVQAAQLFRIASTEYIRRYPHVVEALQQLRAQGHRLWLLSNAQRVFTAYEMRHLQMEDLFDGVYISSDYGCRKPDARFLGALLREQNLDPAKCLMIGNDRSTDIAGAKNLGLATLYLHTQLTPGDQAPADPVLLPGKAPAGCRHFEYEGDNWEELVRLIPLIR